MYSSTEFWPSAGYFMILFTVGSVSAAAGYIRKRSFMLFVAGINGISVILLVSLLTAAFAVSPGSGVVAVSFMLVPIAINLASLKWMRDEVNR